MLLFIYYLPLGSLQTPRCCREVLSPIMAQASLEAGITSSTPVNENAPRDLDGTKEPTSTAIEEEKNEPREHDWAKKLWKVIIWTPKRCRWNPEDPPKFNMALNLLFGFVSY